MVTIMGTLNNISFYRYPGRIRLSINLLEKLNYPKYVRFLINVETKEMAVQCSSKEDGQALKVLYITRASQGAIAYSTLVLKKIFEELAWDEDSVYRTTECSFVSDKIAVVNLETAKKVKSNR